MASSPAASDGALARWARHFRAGYDQRSLIALALLVSVGALVGYRWSDLIDPSGGMDWLLAGTWVFMAALLTWDVSVRRDLVMLAVGFVGGGVIEWWGTNTQIWTYFTAERPPLWILPAWPIATLAIERLSRLLDRALEEASRSRGGIRPERFFAAYVICVPTFVVAMIAFARHTTGIFATQVVILLMAGLTLHCPKPRRDVTMFVAGSLLGIFLEYWGTSRQCWTYYTGEIPPLVAVVAHGFAAIAFARGADFTHRVLDLLASRVSRGMVWRSDAVPAPISRRR
jgi:hypothetical protein